VLGALDFIRPPSSLQGGIRHQPAWLSSTICSYPNEEEEQQAELRAQTVLVGHIFCNGSFQGFFLFFFLFFLNFLMSNWLPSIRSIKIKEFL
jgi:hypothetical protein